MRRGLVLAVALFAIGCGGGSTAIIQNISDNLTGVSLGATQGSVYVGNGDAFTPSWQFNYFYRTDGTGAFDLSQDSGASWCRQEFTWNIDAALTESETNFVIRRTFTTDACETAKGTEEVYQQERLDDNKYRFLLYFNELKDLNTTAQLLLFRCSFDLSNPGGPCDINGAGAPGTWGADGRPGPFGGYPMP
jgi:hypothetical protein